MKETVVLSRRDALLKCAALGSLAVVAPSLGLTQAVSAWLAQEQAGARKPTPWNEIGPFYKRLAPDTAQLRVPNDPGLPLTVGGQVYGTRGNVLAGATIEIWQADHHGLYDLDGYRYRAALKAIPRGKRRAAVDDAIGIAGLGERRTQIIGTLSRGYRQRVGLADALLARPPILILDEPTVGLDPNQIRETHAMIRELARERAVLLSTHILSDVEALASRVVIIDRGRVKAEGTPAALREKLHAASLDEVFAKVTS